MCVYIYVYIYVCVSVCVWLLKNSNNIECERQINCISSFYIMKLFKFSMFSHSTLAISACLSQPCLNNGTCVNVGATYQCLCPAKFTGQRCNEGIYNRAFV